MYILHGPTHRLTPMAAAIFIFILYKYFRKVKED